jgi:crotonobetainyl-CoA:carnitine CoA-transferase CaiB-like acyl-CoA transferase
VPGALDGLRVLEISRGIAASYCGKLLAEYGAEVLKVERPDGDPVRALGPFRRDRPRRAAGGLFFYLNTNKRSLTLNLKTATGRRILDRLVASRDLVVLGLSPGALDRLGLTYDALARDHPRLVVTAITNFGLSGPYRDWQATELVLQAANGMMHLTGDPRREPLRFAQAQTELLAGVNAAGSSLIALASARRDGAGQLVDVSTLETVANTYHQFLTDYTFQGVVRTRGVYDMFPCRDSFIVTIAGQSRTWTDYANFLGAPELLDPKFQTPAARARNGAELREIMARRLDARAPREWLVAAQAERFPSGIMQRVADLFTCPQLSVREFFERVADPELGEIRVPGRPAVLPQSPGRIRSPAPRLGEHNREVLTDLGFSPDAQVRLRRAGVI